MPNLTAPEPVITVQMLARWLAEQVENGHGDLPVCIAYEEQRGQKAVVKATSAYVDEPQRHPAERVVVGTPILG